jgi:hypothetical protein
LIDDYPTLSDQTNWRNPTMDLEIPPAIKIPGKVLIVLGLIIFFFGCIGVYCVVYALGLLSQAFK